ncbi:MAG: hypothetical protein ACR2PA_12000 [Hyphomicrobiaceae bacterium]
MLDLYSEVLNDHVRSLEITLATQAAARTKGDDERQAENARHHAGRNDRNAEKG